MTPPEKSPDPTSSVDAPRNPWLAGIGSFLQPGLGQLYAGSPLAAVAVVALLLSPIAGVMLLGARRPQLIWPLLFVVIPLYSLVWLGQVVHAVWMARSRRSGYRRRWFNHALAYVAFCVAWWMGAHEFRKLRTTQLEPFNVASASMAPSLQLGDQFFVTKVGRAPDYGDVVLVANPKQGKAPLVKRLIGKPGDTVELDGRVVRVNHVALKSAPCTPSKVTFSSLDEHDVRTSVTAECAVETAPNGKTYQLALRGDGDPRNDGSFVLRADQFFVLGDNRDDSYDSRHFGTVSRAGIGGRAVLIWLSLDPRRGFNWKRMGRML